MALSGESIRPDPTLDTSALSPIMKLTERRSAEGNGDFSSAYVATETNRPKTNNYIFKKHIGYCSMYRNGSLSNA
jgi:hypothetical protein